MSNDLRFILYGISSLNQMPGFSEDNVRQMIRYY